MEDPKADLPTSVRSYLIRLMKGLVPTHPHDQSDVIKNMVRDASIWVMVNAAKARWPLFPKLNSSKQRHSIAYFVALVMTRYGIKLKEQQVRRIYRDRAERAARMVKFLTGSEVLTGSEDQSF